MEEKDNWISVINERLSNAIVSNSLRKSLSRSIKSILLPEQKQKLFV